MRTPRSRHVPLAVASAVLSLWLAACASSGPGTPAGDPGNADVNANANLNANANGNANGNDDGASTRCPAGIPYTSSNISLSGTTVAGDPYAHVAPPVDPVPAVFGATRWSSHLQDDLMPFWRMPAAQGTPVGNFPTYRNDDGSLGSPSSRKVRMMGRQTYAYAIGYLVTGDESLLDLARAGTRWMLDHARDRQCGGWYVDLDASGGRSGTTVKYAQDASYAILGPASYFYVTADPEAEQAVLDTRDMLFGPYWDGAHGRILDAMDDTLTTEAYGDDGHPGVAGDWELVAQVDPITAFLLLSQPGLSDAARRDQMLDDLHALAEVMLRSFWSNGQFWGTSGQAQLGSPGFGWHTDAGHMLKSYWAVTQIDKRLADEPYAAFLDQYAGATLRGFAGAGQWGIGAWWEYAEADQLAATLAMRGDATWIPTLAGTAAAWDGFVDHAGAAHEVWDGMGGGSKCNEWKNGFHSTEHATVMYLFSHWLNDALLPLYFAWPAGRIEELAARARPYTFRGRVARVEDLGVLRVDGVPDADADPAKVRHKVRVSFDQLH